MSAKSKFKASSMGKYGIFFVLIGMIIILSFMSSAFFTVNNMLNILRQVSITGVLAMGMTFVLVTGGIDLSVGSVLAVAGVIGATFAHPESNVPVIIPILISLGVGLLCGFINGAIVAKGGVNPFITTLGMMTVARGVALLYTNGRPINGQSDAFKFIGRGSIGVVAVPVYIFVAVCIISAVILHKSKYGRHIFAVGGNENSALVSGISASKVKMFVYMYSGILAGLAGIMLASRTNAATPNAGDGYEMDAIAAAVIGGTSTSGGKGGVYGTIIGALIMIILTNGMDILNVSSYIQQIIKGIIIVLAVFLDQKNKKN